MRLVCFSTNSLLAQWSIWPFFIRILLIIFIPSFFTSSSSQGGNSSVKVGSTRSSVAAPGVALSSPSLKRSVVVITYDELSEGLLVDVIDKRGAESVLILLAT